METYRYLVYCNGGLRIETEYVGDACLYIKALFEHYYKDPEVEITIKRVSDSVECVSDE